VRNTNKGLVIIVLSAKMGWSQVFNQTLDLPSSDFSCEKFIDPKKTIKKIYTQQMKKKSPNSMEVTDEYFSWSKEETSGSSFIVYGGKTTISNVNSVYFNSIKDLRVIKKKGRYEIRFTNKANGTKHFVYLKDRDLAVEGYYAINCMMQKQTD
jgi:hypothetical protein